MHKKLFIGIEEFAAFLDGNLPAEEIRQISQLAKDNYGLRGLIDASAIIDDTIASYGDDDISIPDEILHSDFIIPQYDVHDERAIFENAHIQYHSLSGIINEEEQMDDSTPDDLSDGEENDSVPYTMADSDNQVETSKHNCIQEAQKQFGLEPLSIDFDPNTYQWEQDTCAIRSQEIVMRSYGVFVPQSDLITQASENGWYTPGKGTDIKAVGNLLDLYNIPNHRLEHANVFNLVDELGQGHKIIVGVDVDELYGNSFWQSIKECLVGRTPNHAMIVSGLDTSDPSRIRVVLTDPGTGETLFECPYEKFLSAWNDSNCFMVATDQPAPLQYNQESMINFDYDKGHVPFVGKIPFEQFQAEVVTNADVYLAAIEECVESLDDVATDDFNRNDLLDLMLSKVGFTQEDVVPSNDSIVSHETNTLVGNNTEPFDGNESNDDDDVEDLSGDIVDDI